MIYKSMNKIYGHNMYTPRNRYHTSIKIACKLNILSLDVVNLIPRSTLHRFHNTDYSGLFGTELAASLESNEMLIRELLHCQSALIVSRGIIQIKNTILRVRESAITGFQKMKEIIFTIIDVKDSIALDTA